MSLHFILDGYNIIKKIPLISSKKIKDARKELTRLIEEKRLTGSKKNKVTLVFDGDSDDFEFITKKPFPIIFTKDADQKIKDLVGKTDNPKNVVVVTDDKEIKFSVRSLGAKVLDTEVFLSKIKRKKVQYDDLKSEISLQEQFEITEELKGIWLGR